MRRVVLALCGAEVLTMAGMFAFPTLLPAFQTEWDLNNTQAGWISGITFAGYAVAVPVLTALTDRLDARRIYIFGALMAGLSCLGFAVAAQGFWTALLFRALAGIGLAGTYMPGLRALVDRTHGPLQARWMSWYTASFSLGTSFSFLYAGMVADLAGWRVTYGLAAALAVVSAGMVAALLAPVPPPSLAQTTHLLDFRPVFRNRPALGYVLAYAAHMWELFGLRSWIVAFLAFAALRGAGDWPSPTMAATASALFAMIGSIGGADLATRFDRRRVCALAALASGGVALGVGFTAGWSYGLVVGLMLAYSALVQVDSAALTTGAVFAAEPGRRGATIAVHSLVGFAAAFIGPLAFGWILDRMGGQGSTQAWGAAFAGMGAVALLGPLALWWSGRK